MKKTTSHIRTSLTQYNSREEVSFLPRTLSRLLPQSVVPFSRQSFTTSSYFFPLTQFLPFLPFWEVYTNATFYSCSYSLVPVFNTIEPNSSCSCLKHPPATSASWTAFVLNCCLPNLSSHQLSHPSHMATQ